MAVVPAVVSVVASVAGDVVGAVVPAVEAVMPAVVPAAVADVPPDVPATAQAVSEAAVIIAVMSVRIFFIFYSFAEKCFHILRRKITAFFCNKKYCLQFVNIYSGNISAILSISRCEVRVNSVCAEVFYLFCVLKVKNPLNLPELS